MHPARINVSLDKKLEIHENSVKVYLILSCTKVDDQSTLALLLRVRPAPSNLYTNKQYHHISMAPHPLRLSPPFPLKTYSSVFTDGSDGIFSVIPPRVLLETHLDTLKKLHNCRRNFGILIDIHNNHVHCF